MQGKVMRELANQNTSGITPEIILKQHRQLQEIARGYRQAQILLTCVDLGVFEALAGNRATAHEVAETTGTNPRAMELLMNAAAAFGLLEKRESNYSNTVLTENCLTSGKNDLSRSLRLDSAFYRRWGSLPDVVRTGKRPEENRRDEQPEDWVRDFIYALYNTARPIAPAIAEALALPEDRPARVIDVGGGHGGYSLALAQRYPLLTATVFELPRVVPVARGIIAQTGLADRVFVQEGDFQYDGLGYSYDVALLFGVLNGESPEGRLALIKKVFEALKPGGKIVIRDFVLDPDRAGPVDATVFALQMLLATDAGGLDTRDDWERWLGMAGFNPPYFIPLPDCLGSSLTVAIKPVS
jgi:SAM-dependent methyltransferase